MDGPKNKRVKLSSHRDLFGARPLNQQQPIPAIVLQPPPQPAVLEIPRPQQSFSFSNNFFTPQNPQQGSADHPMEEKEEKERAPSPNLGHLTQLFTPLRIDITQENTALEAPSMRRTPLAPQKPANNKKHHHCHFSFRPK